MNYTLSLIIFMVTATLFQGCGESEETYIPPNTAKTTTIVGKATLASVSDSQATVCLDTNYNKTCESDEPNATVDNEGAFRLTTQANVENGMLIIVSNGYTIIPFKDTNASLARSLKFYKAYQSDDGQQNINIVSTLIAEQLENNGDNNYQRAIDDFSSLYPNYINADDAWFDDRIPKDDLLLDPVDEAAGWFFGWFGGDEELLKFNAALQNIVKENNSINIQAKAASRVTANENNLPEESALDEFYNTSGAYFDELLGFIEQFINWISSVGDDEDAVTEPEIHPPAPEPTEPQLVIIQRDHLNGIWFIIDASGDRTCSDIRSDNDISVTEADGGTTDLTLTYDNTKKTMLLKLGFFTADTIQFENYFESDYDNPTFTGNYLSDGETLNGYKVDTLDACKYDADKLGLSR